MGGLAGRVNAQHLMAEASAGVRARIDSDAERWDGLAHCHCLRSTVTAFTVKKVTDG